MVSNQLHADQLSSNVTTRQQLDEHTRLLSNIVHSQTDVKELLQPQPKSEEQHEVSLDEKLINPWSQSSNPVIRIRAHAFQHHQAPCTPYCKCACHNVRDFQSPSLLYAAVGSLFVGYSGYPIGLFKACTETGCISQSSSQVSVHYLFPSWFLTKALSVTLVSLSRSEISTALTIRSVVPQGAEIMRLAELDDSEGIKLLMRSRLASPNDSDIFGYTALYVSTVHELGALNEAFKNLTVLLSLSINLNSTMVVTPNF